MKLHIAPKDWILAKTYFANHTEKKYIPSVDSTYFFIKTDDTNEIFALARKKHRAPYILGKGKFSTVVTAEDETGTIHACKLFDPNYFLPDDYSIPVMQRLDILKGQTIRFKKKPYVFMDNDQETLIDKKGYQIIKLAPGKSLYWICHEIDKGRRSRFNTLQKDMIALNACLELLRYHQNGIIHGDISFSNILVHIENDDIIVTLVDQGFSLLTQGQSKVKLSKRRGTLGFAAPEIYSDTTYSFQSDIFALGIIFEKLRRPQWAKNCLFALPQHRFSLYEILSLILNKLLIENGVISPHNLESYNQAMKLVIDHFSRRLEDSIPLSQLLRCDAHSLLFDENELELLALHLCHTFHQRLQINSYTRIYGYDNFIIQKKGDNFCVIFDETNQKTDDKILPPEIQQHIYYPEKSPLYSLGMIIDAIGITPGSATNLDFSKRSTLLEYMSGLLEFAKETPDNPYQAKLDEFESYISHFKKQISSERCSSSSNSVNSSNDTSSDDTGFSGDEHICFDRLEKIYDDLEREMEAISLPSESYPSLLRQYDQKPLHSLPLANENLAAAAGPSTDPVSAKYTP